LRYAAQINPHLAVLNCGFIVLQTNKQVALNRLKNAMGMPLNEDIVIIPMANYESFVNIPQESTFETANILDHKIQTNNILLQEFDVKRKQAAFIPTVSAYARYGVMSFGNEFGSSFSNWVDFSTIGLKATIPIFSGYRKNSQLKQSEISLLSAKTNLELTDNNLNLAFRNSNAQPQKSQSDLGINPENLSFVKWVFDCSNLEYQKGVRK
jgi:outer membrane protein